MRLLEHYEDNDNLITLHQGFWRWEMPWVFRWTKRIAGEDGYIKTTKRVKTISEDYAKELFYMARTKVDDEK